jgi:hypothetical protein
VDCATAAATAAANKSFLVLFFKKEPLAYSFANGKAARTNRSGPFF